MRNANFTEIEWIVATDGMGQPMIEVAPPVTAKKNLIKGMKPVTDVIDLDIGAVGGTVKDAKELFSNSCMTKLAAHSKMKSG